MHIASTQTGRTAWRRSAFIASTALLLAAVVGVAARHDIAWWQPVAFWIAPDLALLLGIDTTLEKGRLHPRAVPLYNAAHSYRGPALLAVASIVLPAIFLVAALTWAFHLSLDRSAGYGMRTRDGFQRP